jgi:chromate transporter
MAKKTSSSVKKVKRLIFLKDVFSIAISAYGGPNMHLALYNKKLVEEKKYLSSDELLELYSLCQMLPGPSSTQTLTSIGYKFGGPFLAFLTLLVWIFPAFILLTFCAIFIGAYQEQMLKYLRFVQPVAVAFVLVAGIKMLRKSVDSKLGYVLAFFAFGSAALLRHPLEEYVKTPWIFPVVLVIGGIVSYFASNIQIPKIKMERLKIPWIYLVIMLGIFLAAGIVGKVSSNIIVILFENCYRFGTIVFGGGNVLIPMMLEQFVNYGGYFTSEQFINGVGLVQAIPGPIFTIASFTGATALAGQGIPMQVLASFTSTVAIFLPGSLLIFFVYPVWKQIKQHPLVVKALPGVIAASCGLVIAAAYLMFLPIGLNWIEPGNFYYTNLSSENSINYLQIFIILNVSVMLFRTKIKSPWYILVAILAGIVL